MRLYKIQTAHNSFQLIAQSPEIAVFLHGLIEAVEVKNITERLDLKHRAHEPEYGRVIGLLFR